MLICFCLVLSINKAVTSLDSKIVKFVSGQASRIQDQGRELSLAQN